MNYQRLKAVSLCTVLSAGLAFAGTATANQTLDSIRAVSKSKIQSAKKSQTRINKLQEDTDGLITEFKQTSKEIEGLKVYNKQLQRQLDSQTKILDELNSSFDNVTVIQRQIQPLISRMLDSMEQYIELDAPYKKTIRLNRVAKQRQNLSEASITPAEKFRQVVELYKIEAELSRKIDTYPATIEVSGSTLEVDVLAVGRVALMFQTTDGSRVGAWDTSKKQWVDLDVGTYKKSISGGIRMALKKAQNDILTIPVLPAEVAK